MYHGSKKATNLKGGKNMPEELIAGLSRHIGRTITIFTTSGGLSGRPISNRVYKSTKKINIKFTRFFIKHYFLN